MGKATDMYEAPLNYEQKCLCILCLDISGSMSGTPIRNLNDGLSRFQKELLKDDVTKDRLEVGIIGFGSKNSSNEVEEIQAPTLLTEFTMPHLDAWGSTPMLEGIRAAIDMVHTRKNYYKMHGLSYYRPWIVLMTDGYPNDPSSASALSKEIQQANKDKDYCFVPIGVGDDVDENLLKSLAQAQFPYMKLDGVKFIEFFTWLSNSMSTLSKSSDGAITLADPSDWLSNMIK